jgi:hypothetical protein
VRASSTKILQLNFRNGRQRLCAAANARVNSPNQAQGIANQVENIANPETNTSGGPLAAGFEAARESERADQQGQTAKASCPEAGGLAVQVFVNGIINNCASNSSIPVPPLFF